MPKNLLLADDSITIQKVVGITFANEDYKVTSVDNGEDAIARAKELRPDVILADVVMPKRNGYEVCEAVKSDPSLKHIPVLLLAGTFEAFDEARARAARADGHIGKPFESQALINKVNELVTGKPAQAAPAPAPRPAAPAPAIPSPAPRATMPATGAVRAPAPPAAPRPQAPAGAPLPRPPGAMAAAPPPGVTARPAVQPQPGIRPPAPAMPPPSIARPPSAGPPGARPFAPGAPPPGVPPAARTPAPQVAMPQGVPRPAAPAAPYGRPPGAMPAAPRPPVAPQRASPPVPGRPAAPAPVARPSMPFAPVVARAPAPVVTTPTPSAEDDWSDVAITSPLPAPKPTVEPRPAPAPQAMPSSFSAADTIEFDEGPETAQEAVLPTKELLAPASPVAKESKPSPATSPAVADGGEAALRAALSSASREVIERIVWEVVPPLAETIIRENLDRLVKGRQS